MSRTQQPKETYQLPNGMWAFRAFLVVDGIKHTKNEFGNPFKTKRLPLFKCKGEKLKTNKTINKWLK